MRVKDYIYITSLIVITLFIPYTMLLMFVCGLLDFNRSKTFDFKNWKRYFLGNGLLTWVLSPLNLLIDLFCDKNVGIYKLENLSKQCQSEINLLIDVIKNKPDIIDALSHRMDSKNRGMIFFKWYGKNIDNSIKIPEYHRIFKYVTTIGVSVFNKNQKTSIHYGPLRATIRVLYNIIPVNNDNIYIDVAGKRHKWHDNPLFIFDDTLMHQSVNISNDLRYCMFIDIMRPGSNVKIMRKLLSVIRIITISFNFIFYKNWDMIK